MPAARREKKKKGKENLQNYALARSYLKDGASVSLFLPLLGGLFLGGWGEYAHRLLFWRVKVLGYILRGWGWGFKGHWGIILIIELRLSNFDYQVG